MKPTLDLDELEVDVRHPALVNEPATDEFGVADVPETFGGSDVEPDFEGGLWDSFCDEGKNAALIPPDRRRKNGEASENLRVFQAEIKRDEAAKR